MNQNWPPNQQGQHPQNQWPNQHHYGHGYQQQGQYAPIPVHPNTPVCQSCGYRGPWIGVSKVSAGGWVVFVILLILCFPLFFIPLVAMRTTGRKCGSCHILMGWNG